MTRDERRQALDEIANEVRSCTACRLHEGRTRAVPGEGDPDTEVVFVGEGQTAPVQPVGTPRNLLVKVNSFSMPLLPDGAPADFVTDLSVFQDGQEIARKQIRVNDPLEVQGYVFHQNAFGPAVDLTIHDAEGGLVVARNDHRD